VDLLSGTLLRLSSVKSGIMDENDKEKKREKGGRVEEGLNESMVLLPRSCQRGVPSPLSHAQGIYYDIILKEQKALDSASLYASCRNHHLTLSRSLGV
jgi:hypothetical protein